jgi:hypothetical protein
LIFDARRKELNMANAVRAKFQTSFGVFSPTGRVVMVFANNESSELAREALLAGGFSKNDVSRYTKDEVIAECEESNKQVSNPVQIGEDVARIAGYLALSKEGCGFLAVYADEDDRTKQAVAIVQPYRLKFAEKYNRLSLEESA